MTLTLAQARSTVLDHLDDDGTRWSTSQVDRALSLALIQTQHDYQQGGGDRFDIIGSFNTTMAGAVALPAGVSIVRGAALVVGTQRYPLFPRRAEERDIADQTIRTLQIRYSPTYSLPTDPTHPLVGTGAVAAPSWDTFDHWVCARAALFCTVKDAEQRPELADLDQRLAGSVMTMARTPTALPFPRSARYYTQYLSWTWEEATKTISLMRKF